MAAEEISFRTKVLKGFLWLGTGTFIGQFISWISTIFVIRLLLPSDYGLMAMAASVVNFLALMSEIGVGSSIVQADQITEKEIRQIFGFVIVTNIAGWLVCFTAAPLIALFYHEHNLIILIRVMSVSFIIMTLYIIPQSLYIREMNFRTKASIDMSAQIGSSLLTLILAWIGLGVWALVIGLIVLHMIKAISYNVARHTWWKPIYQYKGAEKFIRYGLTLTGDRFFNYLYTISDTVIVGKFLGNSLLGIYAVALNLASIPAEKVLPIITQVSFTSYSRIQDNIERIRKNLLRASRIIAYAGFPIFFGMAGVASEAIPLLLGSKWVNIVVPFQLLCLILPFKAFNPILAPAVFAIGQPRINLDNMAITFFVMTLAFLIGVRSGIVGICIAWIIAYPFVFLITSIRCLKIIGIPLRRFLSELQFPCVASVLMLCSLIVCKKIIVALQPLPTLILLIAWGMAFYAGSVILFKRDDYLKLKSMIQKP
jgi:teichuronic acid exporter